MKVVVCLIATLTITAAAAGKPDFSGEWKMNAAKSTLGPVPAPTSFARKMTHAEPSLTITDDQKGGTGDQSDTRTYTTDGKEIAYQANGANVKGAASWEGETLVIRTQADAGCIAISIIEKMTLSGANKLLTDAIHISTPQGEIDITYVFDKQ